VSRLRRDGSRSFRPLYGKPVALCSSSEGKFAGIRCINHLRAVLVRCQMEVITPECSVSGADEAFAEDGQFRDARLHQSMERLCRTLIETSRMLSVRIEV
ncbi:NAD(P)H-dependent oxidoreductase, partial [Mesorhizobium sp.]